MQGSYLAAIPEELYNPMHLQREDHEARLSGLSSG